MPTPKKTPAGKARTSAVMGRALPGGYLGYKKAAREQIKRETTAKETKSGKKMTYNEKQAYAKKRTGPLENQMKADRSRTGTRAKYAELDRMRSDFGLRGKVAKRVGQKTRAESVRQSSMYK